MKYIKKFANDAEYQAFVGGGGYVTPNICLNTETGNINLQKYIEPPALVGDMAYWDGSKVKTISLNKWDISLGTLIGVVVIPQNILPDKKARIISLNPLPSIVIDRFYDGNSFNNYVPITNNIDKYANDISDGYACLLPSDKFTDIQSFVDPQAFYKKKGYSYLIPSPYLGNILNPEFCKTLEGGNLFSDFDGLNKTKETLNYMMNNGGSNFINSVWNYNDGVSNLQWYLPTLGELAFFMARLKTIEISLGRDLSDMFTISINLYGGGWPVIWTLYGELGYDEHPDLSSSSFFTTYPFAMI